MPLSYNINYCFQIVIMRFIKQHAEDCRDCHDDNICGPFLFSFLKEIFVTIEILVVVQ